MEDKTIIKFGKQDYQASEYQQKIFEFLMTGCGNLVVSASAGSSKTTTLVNCTRFIPDDKKVIFVSFNKHIAEEINSRMHKEKNNAIARTCSSIGYEICRENGIGLGEVDNEKYNDYIRQHILELTAFGEIDSLERRKGIYLKNIRELTDLCRYTLSFSIKEIKMLAEKYGVTLFRDECEVVRKILIWGENNHEIIDQTDMVWLPNVLNLNTKRLLKDFIFIDEAQDISIAQQSLIMKCAKRGARIIAVGDRNQQINVWCGSDEAAIEKFKALPNTIELRLPICYRCGKTIIEHANKYSSDEMIPADNAIEGSINYDVSLSDISAGDMVLSRNTAPLIKLQQTLLRRNQNVYVQGYNDIKRQYIEMIKDVNAEFIDINCSTKNGLMSQLYGGLIDEIDKLINEMGMDEEEAYSRSSVLNRFDNIEGIKAIAEGLTTTKELIEKINIVFNSNANNAILLSTVHRAKGLEADNVFIYHPSILEYNPIAKKNWEIKTEQNLRYVAYTRPKKTLNFIKEESMNPRFYEINIKSEIARIKALIGIEKKNKPQKTFKCSVEKKEIDGMKIISSSTKTNRVKGGLKFVNLMKND